MYHTSPSTLSPSLPPLSHSPPPSISFPPYPQLSALEPCRDDEQHCPRGEVVSHEKPLCAALYNENFNQVGHTHTPPHTHMHTLTHMQNIHTHTHIHTRMQTCTHTLADTCTQRSHTMLTHNAHTHACSIHTHALLRYVAVLPTGGEWVSRVSGECVGHGLRGEDHPVLPVPWQHGDHGNGF